MFARHRWWRRLALALAVAWLTAPVCADSVDVTTTGVSGELRDNVRANLGLVSLADRDDLSEAAIRRLHQRATQQIQRALQPFGYYEARVQGRLRRVAEGKWSATYDIEAGDAVVVGDVAVEVTGPGRDEPGVRQALAAQRLESGVPLRHAAYEQLKSALRRAALDAGYLDAAFTRHRLLVSRAAGRADVELTLDTGPRFEFGTITIEQDALTDALALAYVDIATGEPYDQTRLLDAQYALQDSGYYSVVRVSAERERAVDQRVPVTITATARKRQRYSAGVGYATDSGPRVSLGWENRRINNRGHRANFDIRLSTTGLNLSNRYVVPFRDPRTDRYTWLLAHRTEDLGDDTTSQRQEAGLSQTRVFGNWQRLLFLELTREVTEISSARSTDLLLVPGIGFSRTRSDEPVQPRRASRVTADLRGSGGMLGADTNFLRLKLETRLIRPLGAGRILLRADTGVSAVDDFGELPASLRFFAGGDRSVRGFGLNDLGPRNADGSNIGGRHFFAGSAELEWPIAGRWSTAVFVDGGNAFNQFGDELEFSAGIGGRLRTPVGVVRLDVAKPVTVGRPWRLHLGLGPDL